MAKLDRLGWAAGLCFVSHGVRVGIRANRGEVLEELVDYLPPRWKPAASPVVEVLYSLRVGGSDPRSAVRRFHLLYTGSARLARTMKLEEAFQALESDLSLYIADRARRRVFVHAGAVGWRGKAIVIPGRSHSGKSTLVAALVRAGATYYSDDYAVLDGQGRVHPYPKPLSLRQGSDEQVRKCSAEELGGVAGVKPLPVGLVAVTQYKPGARWRPRPLSPGQAVLALLANTVPARRHPAAAFATLDRAVSQATMLKGRRGEAEHTADVILENLGW